MTIIDAEPKWLKKLVKKQHICYIILSIQIEDNDFLNQALLQKWKK